LELHDLGSDREREPIVVFQVHARDAFDPAQALTKRVRVDEQSARGGDDIAPVIEITLEGVEELRPTLAVVVDQPIQPFAIAVADAVLGREHVAIRPEVVVRRDAGPSSDQRSYLGGGGRLVEPVAGAFDDLDLDDASLFVDAQLDPDRPFDPQPLRLGEEISSACWEM